jgi:hypothetical protein
MTEIKEGNRVPLLYNMWSVGKSLKIRIDDRTFEFTGVDLVFIQMELNSIRKYKSEGPHKSIDV